ncbi:hypothetical protein [Paenibacillus riograndensis]|nr:hypothetical protein [Paenibacillus riograndensis]
MNEAVIYRLLDQVISHFPQVSAVEIGVPGAVNQGVINVCDIPDLLMLPL